MTWIDTTPPTLTEVTPVATPTNNTNPSYIFNTTEAGTITYGGSCSSATTTAIIGDNTITLNTLTQGTYNDCTITVTDTAGNTSAPLQVTEFTIDTTPPTLSAGSPTTGTQLTTGTTTTNLQVTTNENATCKFSTTPNTDYAALTGNTPFTLTGTTSHTQVLTSLTNGTSYMYYIRCSDT